MDSDKKGWRDFQKVKFDRKRFARRIKRAETVSRRHTNKLIIKRLGNIRAVSRNITVWLVLLGLLIAGLGIQLLWSQSGYLTTAPASGGLYVEGVVGKINTLNPLFASTDAEASVSRLAFSSLYDYDRTGVLRQDLAKNITIDDTQKVYTINLRSNAYWHDDVPVTAYDVVFTLNLIKNPVTRTLSPSRISWMDVTAKAINNDTVEFTLPAVYAAFPQALTFPIVPEHLLKDVNPASLRESTFSQQPVGSGPFKMSRLQEVDKDMKNRVVHLVANKKYHRGVAKLSRFELRAYADENSLINAVNNGQVSGATDISVTGVHAIKYHPVNIVPEALDSGIFLIMNMQGEITKNDSVRHALQLATDTKQIIDKLGGGVSSMTGPLLEGQLTGPNIPRQPAVDLVGANKYLDDGGWKLGPDKVRYKDKQALEITITTTKNSEYDAILPIIKKQWEAIGVRVLFNVVDTSSATSTFVQNTLQGRNFDVLLYELVIGADPDVYAYWHSSQIGISGYNFANYSSKKADANLSSARSRLEPELRNAKYLSFTDEWLRDVPAIALYQPVVEYVTVGDVKAVAPNSRLVTDADRYADILQWTVNSASVYKTP